MQFQQGRRLRQIPLLNGIQDLQMLVVDLLKPIRPLGRKGLHNAQLNRQRLEDSAHSAIHAVAYNHIVQVVVRLEKIIRRR